MRTARAALCAAGLALAGPLAAAFAQAAPAAEGAVGTIVVAHGATPEWNALVEEVVRGVRTGGPVEVAYLMGPAAAARPFQEVAGRLAAAGVGEIVVVPLLVSSHSGHYEQLRWLAGETDSLSAPMLHHLHEAGIERPEVAVPLRVARGLDDAPELARVLTERALALAPEPAGRALFLVGHGPNSAEDHAAWMQSLRAVAARVRDLAGFGDVKVGLLRDDAPDAVRAEAVRAVRETIELQHAVTRRAVVVVPVFLSAGRLTRKTIPHDLRGLPIVYDGTPILPHPAIADWVEGRVRDGRTARSR